jgi:hypothetical protein
MGPVPAAQVSPNQGGMMQIDEESVQEMNSKMMNKNIKIYFRFAHPLKNFTRVSKKEKNICCLLINRISVNKFKECQSQKNDG